MKISGDARTYARMHGGSQEVQEIRAEAFQAGIEYEHDRASAMERLRPQPTPVPTIFDGAGPRLALTTAGLCAGTDAEGRDLTSRYGDDGERS